CILEDGKIVYLGRFDRQVKLRGFRIELSEVEAIILSKCPEICRASVQVNEEKESLVAFVMPKDIDHKAIRNKLNKTMAKFQVPDIIPVANLPCTHNGKTDHAKVKSNMPELLKKVIVSEVSRPQHKNSKVSLVSHLQALWQDVLALDEKPDVNTNFFDLGGHSLLLLQLQKKIQQQISSVDLVDLFQNPTIKSMANLLMPKDQSLDLDNSITALNNDQVISSNEIAIIGMVGCFPGADSVDELWKMIKTGQHGIHTFTNKELDEMNTKNRNDPHYVPKCGVLSNIDKFDAEFFKISQQEAVSMDPQQRLLLEKSVQALDEAGINPQYEKGRIGVFVAIENSTYKNYSCNDENDPAKEYSNNINTSSGSAATRIAYHLNLKGPAFSLNSACSSSLAALKTAWNSIRCGDCDVAIVGAASIRLPQSGYVAQPGLIFSANGICRPFDHNSDGTILGNSVSVIVLKRLSSAISDQNPISAIIKSIELNNDGNNKIGYTAPSVDGQYEVIKKAIQSANLLPADINFIEAHGTATKLGDPIEIKALTKVFTELSSTTKKQCAISSVKSNIGHCNVAAGFAGLIKTVKALEDRVIPPMAKGHFEKVNPLINFSPGPFYIASELQEFNKTETMYAGVSSFGIGGTNGHCILAEYKKENFDFKDKTTENTKNIRVILPFSAKSINSLNNIKKEFKNYLEDYDLTACNLYNLCNIARTLQIGRAQYEFHSMITATSISDAINQLEQIKSTVHVTSPKENIIFVVPGQGSHSISIHRQIYKSSMLYQKRFKECANILRQYDSTVPDLTSYLEKDIYDITYDPLLIFISSYISAEILRSVFNVQISGIVGHSLGQYVAATLAGVFSLEIALGIVLKRTQIMQKMEKGSMLATNLKGKLADKFIKTGKISLAAINEQSQCIFSGRSKDIEELAIILEIQDYKVKILNGAYGFHSHLTDSILDEFEIKISSLLDKAFQQSTFAIIPFISNATGEWANVEDVYTTKFWREHLRKTVQFESGIKTINSTFTNSIFVNVGIGTVTKIIGNCWNNGIEINWHNYYKHICPLMTKTQLIQLPGYSFNHNCSYWVQQDHQKPLALVETITDSFASNEIDQQPLIKYNNSSTIEGRVILCFKNTLGLKNIDINSNFFDCGGNSLLAISLISLLNKEFNIGLLSPKILFNSPTPLDLTNHIKNILSTNISPTINNSFNKSTSITKLNHGCKTFKPIYMIHPVGGSCVFYKDIINSLGNVTVYGFEYPGLQDSTTIEYHSIQDLTETYLKDLLRNDPSGPYNLFGSSFGGIVAYEMGCKLIKQGKSVNLIMVDTPTGQDIPKSMTSVAETLHYIYSKTYNLDELIGMDDDEKALQIVVEKASTLNIKQNQIILPESSVITSMMLKRYVDVFNFNMKAMRTYQLPRSERPIPIIYFKAKIRRKDLDPEFPEKSWIKIQEINGGKLDCIELDGDHISVNLHPICENITDYIKQYFKSKHSQCVERKM
ncbi:10179_t:CDS:2, partial [Dentiscutata erythropus]